MFGIFYFDSLSKSKEDSEDCDFCDLLYKTKRFRLRRTPAPGTDVASPQFIFISLILISYFISSYLIF